MGGTALHHPRGTDFDRFLYASVGEDGHGHVVTVLSALARLDLDPWEEAAELAALSADDARARLGSALFRDRNVPALRLDHASVAQDLIKLLPGGPVPPVSKLFGSKASDQPTIPVGKLLVIMAILMFLVRIFVPDVPGSGQ